MDAEQEAANQVTGGSLMAIQVAIRAIVRTHPNPLSLVAAFDHENESTLNSLIASKVVPKYINAYNVFLKSIRLDLPGDPESSV